MSANIVFRRIGGRIVPIIKKAIDATGIPKSTKVMSKAVKAVASQKKELKEISRLRNRIPALKKVYKGTRYGDGLLDVEDARLVGRMRGAEKKMNSAKRYQRRAFKTISKSYEKPSAIVGGVGVVGYAVHKYKSKNK